jgi:DNA-binding response OmpR family regulator
MPGVLHSLRERFAREEEVIGVTMILVVEDERALCDLLRSHLEADGYQVMQAFDGPSALVMAEQHQPQLILLDWMLPGMDGLAVCRRLRQRSLTPIIMLTARTEEVDLLLGLEVGADDYIAKPFSIRQVLARVRAVLRRVELDSQLKPVTESLSRQAPQALPPTPDSPAPIVRGSLSITPAQRLVRLGGQEIDLTPKEYELLVLLTSHPGWVFKREVLLQQVWGDSYDGFDRTIDNHVTRLRKKLGAFGEKIETAWGVGYRFKAD